MACKLRFLRRKLGSTVFWWDRAETRFSSPQPWNPAFFDSLDKGEGGNQPKTLCLFSSLCCRNSEGGCLLWTLVKMTKLGYAMMNSLISNLGGMPEDTFLSLVFCSSFSSMQPSEALHETPNLFHCWFLLIRELKDWVSFSITEKANALDWRPVRPC